MTCSLLNWEAKLEAHFVTIKPLNMHITLNAKIRMT